jgi:hypothetical protein
MKVMKEQIITFIIFMMLFYLIGAFIAASFNIAQWSEELRLCVSVFGFMMSFVITTSIDYTDR